MIYKFLKFSLIYFVISINFVLANEINNLNVSGNKRISKETIQVLGAIELNKEYTNENINLILKNLYSTDFFENIEIKINDKTLSIKVKENPIIQNVIITGIKKEEFKNKLLDTISLKNRSSFTDYKLQNDLNLLNNVLKQNGFYFAKTQPLVKKNNENNSIDLNFSIELGQKAKIMTIQFIGDKKIKDRKLKNIIVSEEAKFWKFISNKVYLDEQRINLDKRLLANYYKNKGYYSVDVQDSFVEFKNSGEFNLVYKIEAGNKFNFNKLNLTIPDSFEEKDFENIQKLLSKLEGEIYSLNKLEKILDKIDSLATTKSYEFIDAEISETIIDKNNLNITISFSESEKFYVERINILGNSITLEEVIRNSLIVDEGDPLNEILFNKSINNLKAKGIFKSVKHTISEGSSLNFKNIDLKVEEKPTGEISLGAGVGTSGGSIGGGIKENNFLGKGISLDSNINIDENRISGQFIYSKPNFNYSDNTLFTSFRTTSTDYISDFGYKTNENSLSFGTSFEQYENLYLRPSILASFESLETTSAATDNLKKQKGDYFDTYLNYSLDYDLRNQRYQTTSGYRTFFSQQLPIISENNELVNTFEISKYKILVSDMVGKVSFYSQAANSLTDDDVRISKRLYVPYKKLRGFQKGKVGPKDNESFIGGNYVSALNMSTTLPQILPSFQNTDFSLFLDMANVWGIDYNSELDDKSSLRSSAGLAIDLLTPIGPLNFAFSETISKASSDKTESFRFNIGTSF
jgi:outer membrane protein insertion porin family